MEQHVRTNSKNNLPSGQGNERVVPEAGFTAKERSDGPLEGANNRPASLVLMERGRDLVARTLKENTISGPTVKGGGVAVTLDSTVRDRSSWCRLAIFVLV